MTLNNSPYFCVFSPNSIALQANHVTVVENTCRPNVRKILSPSSSLPLLANTLRTLQRGLSAIAELLVVFVVFSKNKILFLLYFTSLNN